MNNCQSGIYISSAVRNIIGVVMIEEKTSLWLPDVGVRREDKYSASVQAVMHMCWAKLGGVELIFRPTEHSGPGVILGLFSDGQAGASAPPYSR